MKIIVQIEEMKEGRKTYYLATSPDIKGLLVEGATIDEVIKTLPDVLFGLLMAQEDRLKAQQAKAKRLREVREVDFSYNFTSQLVCA